MGLPLWPTLASLINWFHGTRYSIEPITCCFTFEVIIHGLTDTSKVAVAGKSAIPTSWHLVQRPPAGGDQTPRQTDARCPNAPTFTGRDCHLQSSRNVVTLIRRAHAASAVFSSSLVTRTLHRVPSSTPRSLPFDRFVAAYNSYHCAPPFQV